MKTFLMRFLLGMLLVPLYTAGASAWIWLPLLMNHWLGIIIGVVIHIGTEALYYKFFGDN